MRFTKTARAARAMMRLGPLFLLAACSDATTPTLPYGGGEMPVFTAVSFDYSTLRPAAGTTLTSGSSVQYVADAGYQYKAGDFSTPSLDVYVGYYQNNAWVNTTGCGSYLKSYDPLTASTATLHTTGSFTVPSASTCGATNLRMWVGIYRGTTLVASDWQDYTVQ